MPRKKIVVLMNCHGHEIVRYLRSSAAISCQYACVYIPNMVYFDDEPTKRHILSEVSTADVLITQNVFNVEWLRNENLAAHIPKHCRFFRFAFWRFHGFWPIDAERYHDQLWYPGDELGPELSFADYIGASVPGDRIIEKFEAQVERWAQIEAASELKMLPFFLDNYRRHRMFSDEWHPSPLFFQRVIQYVMVELGLVPDVRLLGNDGVDNFRNRFVPDTVAGELGLTYDRNLVPFYDAEVESATWYAYCQHAIRHFDRGAVWTRPKPDFEEWCEAQGLGARPVDVARWGTASQSSRSEWSHPGDAQRAVSGTEHADFAFHTGLDLAPWWAIDLHEFRKVRAIEVWNRRLRADRAAPMTVRASTDGLAWRDVTTTLVPFGDEAEDRPLTLEFEEPLLTRHIKLSVDRPSYLHLRRVGVFSDVVGA